MSYTMESIDNSIPSTNPVSDIQIKDGPTFTGYDPNGHTTITGTQRIVPEQQELKQETNSEEAPQEEVRLSSKISALARKEQAQRQRELKLKARELELEAKLKDAEKFQSIRERLKNKDYSAVDELDVDYNEFSKHTIDKLAAENPEELRHKELQAKLDKLEKAQEEQTQREFQANQNLWKQEIAKVVSENEEFKTIKELNMEEAVLRHINDSFDEDGTELSAEDAAREIEAELEKRVEKFASLTKVRQKIEESRTLGPPKAGAKTITQQMTVTSQKPVTKPFHLMSESEQLAEAIRRVHAEKLIQR